MAKNNIRELFNIQGLKVGSCKSIQARWKKVQCNACGVVTIPFEQKKCSCGQRAWRFYDTPKRFDIRAITDETD